MAQRDILIEGRTVEGRMPVDPRRVFFAHALSRQGRREHRVDFATIALPLILGALLALVPMSPAGAVDREKGARDLIQGGPVFFDMEPITLPVIEANNVTREIGVLLTIDVADGHGKKEVEDKQRELTTAFITELAGIYGWRSAAARVGDYALIKARLQAAADRVLGPGVTRGVLIRQLIEQQR
jgi:flagellar FliL protein